MAQGGCPGREGGIARASVTVPRRASAVTPAGRARGRLAAPTPQARPASAPRLSSPPWYGRRSRHGAAPARPLSQDTSPRDRGCLFLWSRERGRRGTGYTLAPCLGTLTAWCHSFGYTGFSGLCGGTVMDAGGQSGASFPVALAGGPNWSLGALLCPKGQAGYRGSLRGLQPLTSPTPRFQPACGSGPEAAGDTVAGQRWGTGLSPYAGVGLPIQGGGFLLRAVPAAAALG